MARPLEAILGGDMPSLDGCGDQNIWGELIDFAPDPDELPEDSELLLFFEDCPDMNPKPFFFWNFPLATRSFVSFFTLKVSCTTCL